MKVLYWIIDVIDCIVWNIMDQCVEWHARQRRD